MFKSPVKSLLIIRTNVSSTEDQVRSPMKNAEVSNDVETSDQSVLLPEGDENTSPTYENAVSQTGSDDVEENNWQ